MKKRIFYGTFSSCIGVVLISVLIVSGIFYAYYSTNQKDNLLTEFSYLSHMVELHGTDHIASLETSDRVIVTDKSGQEIIRGENCPENPNLPTNIKGEEVNYSYEYTKLTEKQLCASKRLSDGTWVLLYLTQYSYISMLVTLLPYILLIMLICAVVSLIISSRLSNSIVEPINEINLQDPKQSEIYPEFMPFVEKIDAQNEELIEKLHKLTEQHDEQDKMRREFTANVSHELKTPLTSISGYAELIRDGLAREEDIKGFAGKIHDESQRMITLVGDIIKLSQLDEKEISVKTEKINLMECTSRIIESLRPLANRKKNVTVTLSGDNAEILGPELIVEEIIHNIISNAIKYNRENGTVEVKLRQCIDGVEFSVKDTGIGIPKEDLDRVFERFYRVDKSHSKEIGGTGLGLSIVKHGAKFMGASVSIESELGVGTTVRVLF
ncbi:MAG: ATP-binding protein [Eubacteriales bacterium]|nr:ATP-binding protein [Eubacteriales bacterium]